MTGKNLMLLKRRISVFLRDVEILKDIKIVRDIKILRNIRLEDVSWEQRKPIVIWKQRKI